MRKLWSLFDTFDKPTVNVWDEWDELTAEERGEIEERYSRNRNYISARKLKEGTYGDK
jgi:hypothetical protein